ncbi:MAG TPA: GNAT family N-acetyltransferase [Phycisphaerae bacterium]|nr:GNAT family N-acetyltransferase [Phycisphaerae bacterium]
MVLRPLTLADEAAFLRGYADYAGENPAQYTFTWKPGMSFAEHVRQLDDHARGINVPPQWVPSTMLYAFVGARIIGRVSIRHSLNDYLRQHGGHVGYSVAPPYRRQGFATLMLRLALDPCRALGLEKIMLTCDDDNTASWKVIEKNGGVLAETFRDKASHTLTRRYWIDLRAAFKKE